MSTIIKPARAHDRPSGKMYLSADQLNLVNNILTLVELDSIPAGFTDGIEDTVNHRITPGRAGFYEVKGHITYLNVVADKRYDTTIRINGVTVMARNFGHAALASFLSVHLTALLYLAATDYVELVARSISGDNTVDILRFTENTSLSVQRVR